MNVRRRAEAFHCAGIAAVVMLLITQSPRLQGDSEPPPIALEGQYLPLPPQQSTCPARDSKGRAYVGYIATQADGALNPVVRHCIYGTRRAEVV